MYKVLWRRGRTSIPMGCWNNFNNCYNCIDNSIILIVFQSIEHHGILSGMVFGNNFNYNVYRSRSLLILGPHLPLWGWVRQFRALDQLPWHFNPGHPGRRCHNARVRVHGQRGVVLRLNLTGWSVWTLPVFRGRQCFRGLRKYLFWLSGCIFGHFLWVDYRRFDWQRPRRSTPMGPCSCTCRRLSGWHNYPKMDHGWWIRSTWN